MTVDEEALARCRAEPPVDVAPPPSLVTVHWPGGRRVTYSGIWYQVSC